MSDKMDLSHREETHTMSKTQSLSVTLPHELVEKLKKDAAINYRSFSAELAYIADQYFQQKEKKESAE